MAPELVPWLSVTGLRVSRAWEGAPVSPSSAHPSHANDSSALRHGSGRVLSEHFRDGGTEVPNRLAFETFL